MVSLIYYSLIIAGVSALGDYSFIQPATGPSRVCEGSNVTLQCVVVFISADNITTVQSSMWTRAPDGIVATTLPNHRQVMNSTTGVLTDLMITNVTMEDDSTLYNCSFSANDNTITSSVVLNVTGPPDNVTDVKTTCGRVVQWSNVSSDPVCGPVWYDVTISTEEGILIDTINTIMTNYNITGLNDNTVYHVNVTASNNAGSSNVTSKSIMINSSSGLPFNPPNITSVSPLSDSSFTVNWTISDPNYYSYTVILTNLNTGVMDSFTISENTSNYTVTGLNDTYYNVSVAAVNMCGNKTSDPIAVTVASATATATATPTLTNVKSSGNSTIIIIVVVIVVAIVVAITTTITIIFVLLSWTHKEGFIKPKATENHYAQQNETDVQQEEEPNQYAYARTGPREIVFPSENV